MHRRYSFWLEFPEPELMSGLACWVPGGLMVLVGLLPEIVLQREPLELRQGPVLASTLGLSCLCSMTLVPSAAA
jgi:hypothetical protein